MLFLCVVATGNIFAADAVQLLQESVQVAQMLLENITNVGLSHITVPGGGSSLKLYDTNVLYSIASTSMPRVLTSFNTNVTILPVYQQGRGGWAGPDLDLGIIGGVPVRYSVSALQGADGLNCGYHALKNVIYLLAVCQMLENKWPVEIVQEMLYRMQDVSSFTNLLMPWLKFVIPYRYKNDNRVYISNPRGDYPSGTELEKVITPLHGPTSNQCLIPDGLEHLFPDGLHAHIRIVDLFLYMENPEVSGDKDVDFLKSILTNKDGIYGFVINTTALSSVDTASGYHWIGYVLWKKNGKSTWLYTDSMYSSPIKGITNKLLELCSQPLEKFQAFLDERTKFHKAVSYPKSAS